MTLLEEAELGFDPGSMAPVPGPTAQEGADSINASPHSLVFLLFSLPPLGPWEAWPMSPIFSSDV